MNNWREQFNTLIRDLTSVTPRPKSEVRHRIQSLLDNQKQELLKKIKLRKLKFEDAICVASHYGCDNNCNEGYNNAVEDLEKLKKSI